MGRKRSSPVETRYIKVKRPAKRDRKPAEPPTYWRDESPLRRLSRYLQENEDTGLSRQELVEQFQEYDCPHNDNPKLFKLTVLKPDGTKVFNCELCRMEKRVESRGR